MWRIRSKDTLILGPFVGLSAARKPPLQRYISVIQHRSSGRLSFTTLNSALALCLLHTRESEKCSDYTFSKTCCGMETTPPAKAIPRRESKCVYSKHAIHLDGEALLLHFSTNIVHSWREKVVSRMSTVHAPGEKCPPPRLNANATALALHL